MKNYMHLLFSAIILLASTQSFAQYRAPDIYARNRLAVVHITIAAPAAASNQKPVTGTGFLISDDGYVVTANHLFLGFVNNDQTPITVTLGSLDGTSVPADFIAVDGKLDAALLKLRAPQDVGLAAYRSLPRGDQRKVQTGDSIFVLGFNSDSNISIASGEVAGFLGDRECGNSCWDLNVSGASNGMSGAPVLTTSGTVIGVVVAGMPGTDIIYMLPEQLLIPITQISEWKRRDAAGTNDSGTAQLIDGWTDYNKSGFNFSSNQVVPWSSPQADIMVSNADKSSTSPASFFLPFDAPPYESPQDSGAQSGIQPQSNSNAACPLTGYTYFYFSPVQNGIYCVRTRSGKNFVRITVKEVHPNRIVFDWEIINQ